MVRIRTHADKEEEEAEIYRLCVKLFEAAACRQFILITTNFSSPFCRSLVLVVLVVVVVFAVVDVVDIILLTSLGIQGYNPILHLKNDLQEVE